MKTSVSFGLAFVLGIYSASAIAVPAASPSSPCHGSTSTSDDAYLGGASIAGGGDRLNGMGRKDLDVSELKRVSKVVQKRAEPLSREQESYGVENGIALASKVCGDVAVSVGRTDERDAPDIDDKDEDVKWIAEIILALCGFTIAVVAGFTIKENISLARRNSESQKDMEEKANQLFEQLRGRLEEREESLEAEIRTSIGLMMRAANIKRALYDDMPYDYEEIYDDVRQLCANPCLRFAPIYKLIIGKVNEEDLKIVATEALNAVERSKAR